MPFHAFETPYLRGQRLYFTSIYLPQVVQILIFVSMLDALTIMQMSHLQHSLFFSLCHNSKDPACQMKYHFTPLNRPGPQAALQHTPGSQYSHQRTCNARTSTSRKTKG